jgi:adenylate cyclase
MVSSIPIGAPDAPYQGLSWISNPVAEWLILEAMHEPDSEGFVGGLSERLLSHGIPLWRVVVGARALHPQLFGRTIMWERGCHCTTERERPHGVERSDEYLANPVRLIHQGIGAFRRKLEGADAVLDFPLLPELKADGATDYVIMPLKTSGAVPDFISWTTDRPGGFTTEQLSLLYDLLPLIALVSELFATRRTERDLLSVYLGSDAAQRVLAGEIRRGAGTTIRAVLWYCDLNGFTALADRTPPDELIVILDDYFEAMARPVEARGGEVLKFIGDAILAVFRLDDTDDAVAAQHALAAATETTRAIDAINRQRAAEGADWLGSKIVLHAGEVMYGNVGAADRLDFTVIGPAVNQLTRVEPLSKVLGEAVIATAAFQELCGDGLVSRGEHRPAEGGPPIRVFVPAEPLQVMETAQR